MNNHSQASAGPGRGPSRLASRRPYPDPVAAGQQGPVAQQTTARARVGKPGVIAVAGTAGAAVPAAPGLVLAAAGHPQAAVPLLIGGGIIAMLSMITGAVVRIYESRQRTRRLEIQRAGATAIAAAMARCIDDTHATGRDLLACDRAAEAASVRASAGQTVAQMMPAMLAAIRQQAATAADLNNQVPDSDPADPWDS